LRRFLNPWTIVLLLLMAYFSFRDNAFSSPGEWFISIVIMLPGIVIGLSFHEYAHAVTAWKLGDDTPKIQGRVTINPAAHIDAIGMIALIFVRFGWGKPVQINPGNFKNPRRDDLIVSVAGVIMNFIVALIFTFVLKFYVAAAGYSYISAGMGGTVWLMIFYVIYINLILMIFNLLPIPPLDGFNIITEIFNLKRTDFYYKIYDKGFIILMVLILLNFTGRILTPAVNFFLGLLSNITPLPFY